ncbi:MAG: hypothetical protein ABNH26_00250 [Celeribacter sp.]|jgi:hypothetical protein
MERRRIKRGLIAGGLFAAVVFAVQLAQNAWATTGAASVDASIGAAAEPQQPVSPAPTGTGSEAIPRIATFTTQKLPADPVPSLLPLTKTDLPVRLASAAPTPDAVAQLGNHEIGPHSLACEADALAAAAPQGRVALTVLAGCRTNAGVSITQGPLQFNARTDADGWLSLEMPALSTHPVTRIRFDDGTTLEARADVSDATDYVHTTLQWIGERDLALNAYENAAEFGMPGHLHAGATQGIGRFETLGDATLPGGRMAEIYTAPRTPAADFAVSISVEAEVTYNNCGREVWAELSTDSKPTPTEPLDLRLTLPGCDTVGDFVVMDDMLNSLQVAIASK